MFSGALAGLLKLGAVALTAAGLSAGVYFLVQANEGEEAQRAQAPASEPVRTPEPLSPPRVVRPTRTPTAPTPTFPPADLTPPSDIDTSDWKTYESPLGFTIKYPPGWVIDSVTARHTNFYNPMLADAIEEARARGDMNVPDAPGMASVSVISPNASVFNPATDIRTCESPEPLTGGPAGSARVVAIAGRRAVVCERVYRLSGDESLAVTYFIEFPPGHTTQIDGIVTPPGSANLPKVRAIISSIHFQSPP